MKKHFWRIVYLTLCTAAVLLGTVHTVQAAEPYEAQIESTAQKKVKKPGRVTGLKAVKVTRRSVKLKWGKKKCDGYEVWCAETKNGTYKKVKTLTGKNTNSCRNVNLQPAKLYYFKVRAYNKDGSTKKYGRFSKVKGIVTDGWFAK